MPKYLFISGSPRKGNTDFVLSKIFDSIKDDKEMVVLRTKSIKHCIGCLSCYNKPECVLQDDMKEILDTMRDSEILIIGTPNYFDNVTGLLKDFIDRSLPLYTTSLIKGKKVILIAVGGGEAEDSVQRITEATNGFIKYQKLDMIGSYGFQALNADELKKYPNLNEKIESIIHIIKSA